MPKKPELKWGTKRLRGRIWWVGYYAGGEQQWESTHSTDEKDADALLEKRYIELKTGTYVEPSADRVTVSELFDGLLRDYRRQGRDGTKSYDWLEGVLRKHVRPAFGLVRAAKVSYGKIERYIDARLQAGAANASVNRELALLHRAFVLGRKTGLIRVVPAMPEKLEENNVRKGFFERGPFVLVRSHLPEDLRPPVTFAYWTGCRKGEILMLQWPQVDLIERLVRLEPGETKNDEPRAIPLGSELLEVLKMQKEIRDQEWPNTPWVFFWYATGERIKCFYDSWREACKKAGLVNQDGKAAPLFHDLRRTGVRNLVRAGVPESVAMRISGHKTRSVFERYNIGSESDLHWAARKLDQYVEGQERQRQQSQAPATVPANNDNSMTISESTVRKTAERIN